MANETESNNSSSVANQIEFGETVIGNISEPGDQDYNLNNPSLKNRSEFYFLLSSINLSIV